MPRKYAFSIPPSATVVIPNPGGIAQTVDAVDHLRHALALADASAVATLGGGSDWSVTVADNRELEFEMIAAEVIEAFGTTDAAM